MYRLVLAKETRVSLLYCPQCSVVFRLLVERAHHSLESVKKQPIDCVLCSAQLVERLFNSVDSNFNVNLLVCASNQLLM